jgi:hypothetical protein
MGLFNFMKKQLNLGLSVEQMVRQALNTTELKLNADRTPEQTVELLLAYMPNFYKTHQQYLNCVEYFEKKEWAIALDSLIELANESGHYFSEDYWLALANAADKMNLPDKAAYCRQQIERNARDIKSKTPFGWTTVKADDTHLEHHMSEQLLANVATIRHNNDKVHDLAKTDGVHLKSYGRSGVLYIVNNGNVAEVDFEWGWRCLMVFFSNMAYWTLPTRQLMTPDEKQKVKDDVLAWAAKEKKKIEIY